MADTRRIIEIIAKFRDDVTDPLNELGKKIEGLDGTISGLSDRLNETNKYLADLAQRSGLASKATDDLTKTTKKLSETTKESSKETSKQTEKLKESATASEHVSKSLNDQTVATENATKATSEHVDAQDDLARSTKTVKTEIDKVGEALGEQKTILEGTKLQIIETTGAQDEAAKSAEDWAERSKQVNRSLEALQRNMSETERSLNELSQSAANDTSWDRRTKQLQDYKDKLAELQGVAANLKRRNLAFTTDGEGNRTRTPEFREALKQIRTAKLVIDELKGNLAQMNRELLNTEGGTKKITQLREELEKLGRSLVVAQKERRLGSVDRFTQEIDQTKAKLKALGDEHVDLRVHVAIDQQTEKEVRDASARLAQIARRTLKATTSAETEKGLSDAIRESEVISTLTGAERGHTLSSALAEALDQVSSSAKDAQQRVERLTTTYEELNTTTSETTRHHEDITRVIRDFGHAVRDNNRDVNKNTKELTFLERAMRRLEDSGFAASRGMQNLSGQARNFVIAFAIKYAQSITTALTALAAQLVAVAASAIEAGAALGGALTAGMAQAIPVALVLGSAISRLTSILKVLTLHNQQVLLDEHNKARAHKQSTTSTDALSNATERLADAQRGVVDAQRGVTKARADARKELEDLIIAEQRAQLAAEGDVLSQEEAQRRLRQALRSGTSTDIDQARLAVRTASVNSSADALSGARTQADADRARRVGPEGSDGVRQAKERLADANRTLARTERDLGKAQFDGSASADTNTAAQDRLRAMIKQLTPAEQELYKSLLSLQATYRKNFRPITDIIIQAFHIGVQKAVELLKDPELLGAFTNLAEEMSVALQRVFERPDTKQFLLVFTKLAKDNLPAITDIFNSLVTTFHNIAVAGAPLFKFVVDGFRTFAENFEKVSGRTGHMQSFFQTAKENLQGWADALSGVWDVFTALVTAGSGSGLRTVRDLARFLHRTAEGIRNNMSAARDFFEQARHVLSDVAGIVKDLAVAIFQLFNPGSVDAFTQFIRGALIPALANTLDILGQFVQLFHRIFGAPGLVQAAQFIATLYLTTKALGILQHAIGQIVTTIGELWLSLKAGKPSAIFVTAAAAVYVLNRAIGILNLSIKDLHTVINVMLGAFVGAKLAGALGAFKGLEGAAGKVKLAIKGGGGLLSVIGLLARALGPVGIAGAAAIAVGGLLGFLSSNHKVKVTAEEAQDALRAQVDAMRTLRDFDLEKKNRTLAAQQAELRLEEAKAHVGDVRKTKGTDVNADGKVNHEDELAFQRNLRQAKLDVRQAELDLIRTRRTLKDTTEDESRVTKDAQKAGTEGVKKAKDRVQTVKDEGDSLEDLQKKLKKTKDERNDSVKQFGANSGRVVYYNNQVEKAEEAVRKKQEKIKDAQSDYAKAIRTSGRAWLEHGGNATQFGLTLDELMQYIEEATNEGLSQFGAKKIKFAKRFKAARLLRNSQVQADNFASGNAYPAFAGGGWIPGKGMNDTVPIMAAPGEAILNRHQTPIVDRALKMLGIDGLHDLFKKVNRPHYMARGGSIDWNGHPSNVTGGIKRLIELLVAKFPGLVVGSTTDHSRLTSSGNISDHVSGHAVDLGGTTGVMKDASSYIVRSGLYHQLKQGIHNPNLAVNAGQIVGSSYFRGNGVWAQHINHIHLALAGQLAKVFRALIPKIHFKAEGASFYQQMGQGIADKMRKAANHYLNRAQSASLDSNFDAAQPSFSGDWVKYMGNISKSRGWDLADWKWIIAHESGGKVSNKNPTSTAFGLGQLLDSTYKKYGGGPGTSGSEQIVAMAKYIADRYGDPTRARAFWEQNHYYARGGEIPIVAHDGEMVLTPEQQKKLGGSRYLADLFGFSGGRKTHYDTGGAIGRIANTTGAGSKLEIVLGEVAKALVRVSNVLNRNRVEDQRNGRQVTGRLRTQFPSSSTTNSYSFEATLTDISDALKLLSTPKGKGMAKKLRQGAAALLDGGLLDELGNFFNTFVSNQAASLQRRTFKLTKGVKNFTLATGQLVKRRLSPESVQEAQLGDLFAQREFIGGELNVADEAVKRARANVKRAGNKKDRQKAKADLDRLLEKQNALKSQLSQNLEDIYTAQQAVLQAAVDRAEEEANKVSRKADRTRRLAALKERTGDLQGAFGLRGNALKSEGDSLVTERGKLGDLLKLAEASGNTVLADSLKEKIEDLDVSIQENTAAQAENTIELQKSTLAAITGKSDFITSSLSAAIQVLQKFPGAQGAANGFLQQVGSVLKDTLGQVIDQLIKDFPSLGLNADQLKGMSLPDLVSTIANMVTQHPELADNELWKSIVGSLLGLSSAIKDNTDALQQNNIQNWSSTMWTEFREAIFNGNGGLLPQYQSIATGSVPTTVVTTPHAAANHWSGGDSNINVNMPISERADPNEIAQTIDFVRRTSR